MLERKVAREPEKGEEVRLQAYNYKAIACGVWLWCLATVTPVQDPGERRPSAGDWGFFADRGRHAWRRSRLCSLTFLCGADAAGAARPRVQRVAREKWSEKQARSDPSESNACARKSSSLAGYELKHTSTPIV